MWNGLTIPSSGRDGRYPLERRPARGSAEGRPARFFSVAIRRHGPLNALNCLLLLPLCRGAAAFPLNELTISAVMVVLIALGLYFFAGAWGVFLLWCLALLFVLPQGMAAAILFEGSR